ncbi:MAG TPA: hypothetical protein VGN17_01295 [Bryobacteraceae bacterium]|jgi:hypothetical protein
MLSIVLLERGTGDDVRRVSFVQTSVRLLHLSDAVRAGLGVPSLLVEPSCPFKKALQPFAILTIQSALL